MKIEKINPFQQVALVRNVALAYQQAFGNNPWNEGYKCPICATTTPLTAGEAICPSCSERGLKILMIEYWPLSKIISDFYQEMKKPNSLCLIVREADKVIGFTWGYQINIDQEIDNYLEAPGLSEVAQGNFFYADEAAILPGYQGRGIGKKMVTQFFTGQPQKRVLLRTLNGSPMFNLIKQLGGETILNISRQRVIMTIAL